MPSFKFFILLAVLGNVIGVHGSIRNPKLIENIWNDLDFKDGYDFKNEIISKYDELIQHENPDAKLDTVTLKNTLILQISQTAYFTEIFCGTVIDNGKILCIFVLSWSY